MVANPNQKTHGPKKMSMTKESDPKENQEEKTLSERKPADVETQPLVAGALRCSARKRNRSLERVETTLKTPAKEERSPTKQRIKKSVDRMEQKTATRLKKQETNESLDSSPIRSSLRKKARTSEPSKVTQKSPARSPGKKLTDLEPLTTSPKRSSAKKSRENPRATANPKPSPKSSTEKEDNLNTSPSTSKRTKRQLGSKLSKAKETDEAEKQALDSDPQVNKRMTRRKASGKNATPPSDQNNSESPSSSKKAAAEETTVGPVSKKAKKSADTTTEPAAVRRSGRRSKPSIKAMGNELGTRAKKDSTPASAKNPPESCKNDNEVDPEEKSPKVDKPSAKGPLLKEGHSMAKAKSDDDRKSSETGRKSNRATKTKGGTGRSTRSANFDDGPVETEPVVTTRRSQRRETKMDQKKDEPQSKRPRTSKREAWVTVEKPTARRSKRSGPAEESAEDEPSKSEEKRSIAHQVQSPSKKPKVSSERPSRAVKRQSSLSKIETPVSRVVQRVNYCYPFLRFIFNGFFTQERSNSSTSSANDSPRRKAKPSVMFTGYEAPTDEKSVKDLGGFVTTDPNDCTVLVTDKIRRTTKLMCAMGRGMPIVSPSWIKASKMTKTFLGKMTVPGFAVKLLSFKWFSSLNFRPLAVHHQRQGFREEMEV